MSLWFLHLPQKSNHSWHKVNLHRRWERETTPGCETTPRMHWGCFPLCIFAIYAIGMRVFRLSLSICVHARWKFEQITMDWGSVCGERGGSIPFERANQVALAVDKAMANAKAFHVGNRQINKSRNNTRRQANGQTNETRQDKTRYDTTYKRQKSPRNSLMGTMENRRMKLLNHWPCEPW